ncbi:TonB-dependent receptor [Paucibacter sp. O1-1]|nr:TonB-dependent receptor [Paucibacter sp. O1-1]MDA3826963.1 TonB-dependent receptor [Paucibacter sp. O1-1]
MIPSTIAPARRPAAALSTLALAACLSLGTAATRASAQTAAPMVEAQVPAGPLAEALNRFALQAGVPLVVDATKVQGLRSAGLQGRVAVDQGFERLLAGSGFRIARSAAGYVLQPAPPARPEPVAAAAAATRRVELPDLPLVAAVHASLQDEVLDERMSLSAAKIIVGRDEIEAFGDASMGEVIRRMPSISFAGPPGENNDARIRGLAKEYTQILIDGQPVPGRDFAIDQIPAHLVERLEIIRTTTANIDNQGIAGTVNIILRKPPKERTIKWSAGAGLMPDAPGDGKSANLGLSLGDALDGFRYQFDAQLQNRFGLRSKDRRDYNNGLATLSNREQDIELREHREAALSARLSWRLNAQDEFRLDPRYTYSRENKERDRLKKADLSEAERMDQIKTRQYAGLNGQWQREIGKQQRYTLGFGLQATDTQTDKIERKGAAGQPFTALPGFITGADEQQDERGLSLRAATRQRLAGGHLLDFGLEYARLDWALDKLGWKKENRSDIASSRFRVQEDKLSAYAQDEILIGEHHVLTPGLRLEQVSTRSRVNSAGSQRRDHLQPSPSLHWLSNVDAATNWRASLTRSIRRPKFEDLAALTELSSGTVANPDKIGNPALKPETAWALESSLERYFNQRAGVASVNLFYRRLQDLIEKRILLDDDSGRYLQQPVNVERATTWGLEFDGSYRFSLGAVHGLQLRGNYSWLDSRMRDPLSGRDRPINDQPRRIVNVGIDYEYKPAKLKLGAAYNEVGRLQKVDAVGSHLRVQRQQPSRYLDAYLLYALSPQLQLRVSASNLLEAEKNRPRVTTRPDGSVALFEQEDEASARAFFVRLEGRF